MIASLRRSFPTMQDPYERFLQALEERLDNAVVITSEEMDTTTVTMNSTVRIKDLGTSRRRIVKLVYEPEADALGGKVSVLTGLGAALLGARVGDVVSWYPRGVERRVRIERILYQPPAADVFAPTGAKE